MGPRRRGMIEAGLTRRAFLKAAAATAAAAAAPLQCRPEPAFFSAQEFATLAALCDRILPQDGDPGALALGAPIYIERLLTAFDLPEPFVYTGGPYSGRQPFPDYRTGTPGRDFPTDGFRWPAAPSPLQELYWRAEIYGSAEAGLPPHLDVQAGGPRKGLRDVYREGLAAVDAAAIAQGGAPFASLGEAERDDLLLLLDGPDGLPVDPVRERSFLDLAIQHTIEGCLSAPEYGGNRGGAGWRMVGIEGDSQPLGYSLFSQRAGAYRERPDHPMSSPNPDEVASDGSLAPRPISADGAHVQEVISTLALFLESLVPGGCR
jgi:Gluconate 2-dehydrogenase subunit 3